ncbi:MAG: right-handed parallel beta-helix repeat-containing protein, partial [Lentisphaerae bacterium]
MGLALNCGAHAVDIYVSPSGNDRNPGTRSQPVASLHKAQLLVRKVAGKQPVTVLVEDGLYYLDKTLVFGPEDSGSAHAPVLYRAVNEGKAIISGGIKLQLQWQPWKNGIFRAVTPAGLKIDQLFINGKRQRMARYPNFDPNAPASVPFHGYSANAFAKERAARWANPAGGFIHALHKSRWGGYHYLITGKKANGEVEFTGGWQNNRPGPMHNQYRMVENIFEELDAPGEWFHNSRTNTLYYMPEPGVNLASATVEAVRLRHLIELRGSETAPVHHILFQGFTLRHAARTFMDTREPLLRSDWTIYRGGAVFLTGTEDVQLLDLEFDQPGGNAVFVSNYNRRVLIKGCHIHDCGASGVCFVGDPKAVRNPLFRYGQENDFNKIDRTPGPRTNNYPAECTVADCLIHGIGLVELQAAGVQISMARRITVKDTSIYDCTRAGINIGDGCWGGHLIDRCDVFDTVLQTHDHGAFNSWGRDRYWSRNRRKVQQFVNADPKLPFLDAVETTTIRNSRWRCDHGWDIDLDDGSSNYDIYNNLMLSGGLKLREGFRRHAWNNITVNNGLHPHVWFDRSQDQVYANILMTPHHPVGIRNQHDGQTMVDRNFFVADRKAVMKKSQPLGWDAHSMCGDPMFVDPQHGDFRVKPNSPALKVGFKNFPMDQFGVKKASLRAIARTPTI